MKRKLSHTVALLLASISIAAAQPAVERRADSLLVLMTLDEKVGQLVQSVIHHNDGSDSHFVVPPEQRELIQQGRIGSFLNVVGARETREIQRIAVEESRLKIPLLFGLDVIHGFRTVFPIPLATACSWDLSMIEQSERVAAVEASASGIHWTFAPMVDIARDPRWGRIAEGAGEDPILGSAVAAARVKGFQGVSLASETSLLACAKHFAAYGGAEGGRDYNTVDISGQTLREIYLPPFKAAVDAGAGTLMCSFNEINGVPSSANRTLLTNILRGEWKFDGFVVSDWHSIGELIDHGVARDLRDAAILGIKAGVDMDMESDSYHTYLAAAVRTGKVDASVLDESVRRVLRTKFRLGLFDNPYKDCDVNREERDVLTAAHRNVARRMAQRSIVLLKNQNDVLPLSKDIKTLAVIGPLADDKRDMLGPWSGLGRAEDVVSILDGIKSKVSGHSRVLYAQGCAIEQMSVEQLNEAVMMAKKADAVIVVVGESAEMSGEAASRSNVELPGEQLTLVQRIRETGKPVVVVLANGRPLAIPWIAEHSDGILESWFLGVEAGNAVADVLFGDYNPSGKLTVTIPYSTGQIPVYYNHKNTGRPANDTVKWTSKYIDAPIAPLYPFGFGRSYTTFSYSNVALSADSLGSTGSLTVSVDVRNTGKRPGEEVIQLYTHPEVASTTRPVKELKDFRKVMLGPGESKRIRFALSSGQLEFYDATMNRRVEPGTYKVFVGSNSVECLEAAFVLKGQH